MFKKAQGFYADFLIGLLVLIAITFIFTNTIIDLNSREDKFQELVNDGLAISNSFMSKGYCPSNDCFNDWNNAQPAGRIGFVENGKILDDKFNDFAQLVDASNPDGYKKSKILLGTRNDYVLYFEFNNQIINNAYGKYNNPDLINAENVIKINRILYYNLDGSGRLVKMVILIF